MAGAFHGVGEADVVINVGVSSRCYQMGLERSGESVAETVKKTAFTRIGQLSIRWPASV